MKKVLIVDNYDSFTFNLLHAVEEIIGTKVTVKQNDILTIDEVAAYDYLILSPGPGLPDEAGLLKEIIDTYKGYKKIFGVCLGLQAIAEVYGCKLKNLKHVYHGVKSEIIVTKTSLLYKDLPQKLEVGRYHSWVIDERTLADELNITSRDSQEQIMSIEHKSDKVYAVQYHPESIMTPVGQKILENFLET